MKYIRNISRILIGVVFIFSGFVKGIDPLGSTYKFSDYFTAFGMEQLDPLAFPLAIILSTFEFIVGVALIFNIKTKINSWIVLVFMSFFTLLTLYLAIENPVHDCGCFGDAIIMTNWQTFAKNVVIMVLALIVFIYRNQFVSPFSNAKQYSILGIGIALIVALSFYCYEHLPIIDFRPYNIGTHIPDKMKVPEDAPKAEYKTILKYKKNGKIKEFTMDSLPDSTWQWVETKNIKVKEGYVPPIHDFTISTLEGEDITDIVLKQDKFTFLLISYNLKKSSVENMGEINKIADFCNNKSNCSFICLTASIDKTINDFKNKYDTNFQFYNTDEITLKTIVRSNPGLMLIKHGTILDKWHHNDVPVPQEVSREFLNNSKYKEKDKNKQDKKPEKVSS
jgi:uncharacterized membrane protein YphA (DoxX/SURF4 family)